MRIVRILLIVLLVFSAFFFGALIHSRSWGKRFVALHGGDSRGTVVQRAGEPNRTMRCAALPEVPDGCQLVMVYAGPLSAVMPEFWLLPLDANGHVLRVLHTTRAE